jgi:hypothetical protein
MRPSSGTWIAALFLAIAVVACGSDSTTPPDGDETLDFDAFAVADAAEALVQPLQPTVEPSVSLRDAFEYLQDREGVTFDREPSPLVERARRLVGLEALGVARSVEFPSTIQGETFVYDEGLRTWMVDTMRTGAPETGVRIIWYTTDQAGNFDLPLTERGFIDLTDLDVSTDMLNQLGVRIVETSSGTPTVFTDMSQGYWIQGDVEWSEHFEATGVYGDGTTTVTFSLDSDAAGNDDTGDQDVTYDIVLEAPSASYTLALTGSDDGSTGTTEEGYAITLVADAVSTQLGLDFLIPQSGSQEGTGSISHDGASVANISVQGTVFQYTAPNGRGFTDISISQLDTLVQTMLLSGFIVLLNLPLLFP